MSDETHLAFAHPEERADAMSDGKNDRISLRDYIVDVEIGAFHQERGNRQRVKFNVVVEVARWTGLIDDDVDRILSYDRVSEAINTALQAERINLLETLAGRVAELILREPQALRVFVRIEKLDRGPFSLGVEIMRDRKDFPLDEVVNSPAPRVLYLSVDAFDAPDLADWIGRVAALDAPLVICVDRNPDAVLQTGQAAAQRRVELLGLDQAAWCLAARDPRCVVAGTRTELDWAMKNDRISVWAPSKIVLDAVNSPQIVDGLALSAWFANEMSAAELLIIGAPPVAATCPVRAMPVDAVVI